MAATSLSRLTTQGLRAVTRKRAGQSSGQNPCATIRSFTCAHALTLRTRPAFRPKHRTTPKPRRLDTDGKAALDHLKSLEAASCAAPEPHSSAHAAASQQPLEPDALPWYLQSQHTRPKPDSSASLGDAARLPEVATSSPPMLEPLISYISKDLGIDYLSLLDLRQLEPPACLGTNLFMLLGTARSEKHVHVSADRLCRWLRSALGLRPVADGLIGRNELKVKMKRKEKRLKILAHVGSTDDRVVDDGLRTGWVCVTIPNVSPGDVAGQDNDGRPEASIGFGQYLNHATVVVQLLTEEKRAELSLEQLWGNRIKRQKIKADEAQAEWKDEENHSAIAAPASAARHTRV